jgi:polysaccharide biosynthesis/export protein
MKLIIRFFVFSTVLFLIFSCATREKMAYLNDVENQTGTNTSLGYEVRLQKDDLLSIIVSAENPEITYPFNLPQIQVNYTVDGSQSSIKTYLIDKEGYIDFPVLGKVKLDSLTRLEANQKLTDLISKHIKNPSINLRILNYKVSVLGEVNKPGTFPIQSDRVTILEALSMAGDLTIFGKRNNILLIRETNGNKSYNRIDITKSDFTQSPFYYLSQNDVIIIEPNKTKMNSSNFGPNITTTISALSLLTTVILLITTN